MSYKKVCNCVCNQYHAENNTKTTRIVSLKNRAIEVTMLYEFFTFSIKPLELAELNFHIKSNPGGLFLIRFSESIKKI